MCVSDWIRLPSPSVWRIRLVMNQLDKSPNTRSLTLCSTRSTSCKLLGQSPLPQTSELKTAVLTKFVSCWVFLDASLRIAVTKSLHLPPYHPKTLSTFEQVCTIVISC